MRGKKIRTRKMITMRRKKIRARKTIRGRIMTKRRKIVCGEKNNLRILMMWRKKTLKEKIRSTAKIPQG